MSLSGHLPPSRRSRAGQLPTAGPLRWLRGGVVGTVATSLALVGHLAAGGSDPSVGPFLAVLAAACAVGVALSGRRWRLPSLVSVLVGAQLVFHLCFEGASAGSGTAMPMGPMAGHVQPMQMEHGGWMLVAHAASAWLTAVLLRRGEDWCWSLLEILGRPLRGSFSLVAVPATRRLRLPPVAGSQVSTPVLLAGVQPRRGPPMATGA